MRRLGLLGGMSWESTALYYRLINEYTRIERGGLHSAPCLIHSLDFSQLAKLQTEGRWEEGGILLAGMAVELENIGAEAIIICANTMHKVADRVQSAITVPLLHIIDATALELRKAGICKSLLLGTRYTMEDGFYLDYLQREFAIEAIVPGKGDRDALQGIIYNELCQGQIHDMSRALCLEMIEKGRKAGAQGVILGCTELALLIEAHNSTLRVFDSTDLHARQAVAWALGKSE